MIEAMKQALEALDGIHPGNMTPMAEEYWNKAITTLRTAIEQAEKQEPVRAWFTANEFVEMADRRTREWAKQTDLPDFIAGAFGVSRGTSYDLMREALKEAAPVQERSTRACRSCGGSGERDTGIAESPTAICKPCAGTGQITTPPAAPVQKPAAVVSTVTGSGDKAVHIKWLGGFPQIGDRLYTTPPAAQRQWVGLTDEAIWLEYQTLWPFHPAEEPRLAKDIAKFARAIEAKLREKNT